VDLEEDSAVVVKAANVVDVEVVVVAEVCDFKYAIIIVYI